MKVADTTIAARIWLSMQDMAAICIALSQLSLAIIGCTDC